MNINSLLPDLEKYRASFIETGVVYPLPLVTCKKEGLLESLPKTHNEGWPWNMETDPSVYTSREHWPKITIVTPTYNQGQYIEETIRAVLLQNYPNLEYIVMDGGSTDDTKEILEKYAPWLSYYESSKDRGQGHAINKGFSLASGEIYGWINSDDFYMDESFYTLAKAFIKSKVDIVYGDSLVLNENESVLYYDKANYVTSKYLFVGGIIMQHSCFWKAEVHQPITERHANGGTAAMLHERVDDGGDTGGARSHGGDVIENKGENGPEQGILEIEEPAPHTGKNASQGADERLHAEIFLDVRRTT